MIPYASEKAAQGRGVTAPPRSTASQRAPRGPVTDDRPVIRVLHTLARTGGTVVGKCLAVMPGVMMLSEVNPAVTALLQHPMTARNPDVMAMLRNMDVLHQAHKWYGLLKPADLEALKARRTLPPFEEAVALIHERALARGGRLVLRDWTHLDYAAAPFIARATHRRSTAESLSRQFRVVGTAFVRHPIDQWLSMQNVPMLKDRLPLASFLEGCRRFAEEAAQLGFVRYEDFTKDPDAQLRVMCRRLDLPFDPTYAQRWHEYRNITGDTKGTRAQSQILLLPRRQIDEETIARFRANEDYRATIELLRYQA